MPKLTTTESVIHSGKERDFFPDCLSYSGSYIASITRNANTVLAKCQIYDYSQCLDKGFPYCGNSKQGIENNFVLDMKKFEKVYKKYNLVEFNEDEDESKQPVNIRTNPEKGWINFTWTVPVGGGIERQYNIASINISTGAVNAAWIPMLWGKNVRSFYKDNAACEDAKVLTKFFEVRRDVCSLLMDYAKQRVATKQEVEKLEEKGLSVPKNIKLPRSKRSPKK